MDPQRAHGPEADGWARLAEPNEARAYASLIQGAGLSGFGALRRNGACLLVSPRSPGSVVVNRVLAWGVDAKPTLESLDDFFVAYAGRGFGIDLNPLVANDEVLGWLKARGLRRLSSAQVMVRAASDAASRYEAWSRSTGLRIEPAPPEATDAIARISCENFRLPAELGELLAAGARAGGWRRWLALDGEQTVGASLSYVDGEMAWFGWTSVLPSHRGRWVHAGIVARQLDDAAAAGCRWVTTETARPTASRPDPVHHNLRRFGFADAYLRPTYVYAPSGPRRQGTG